MNLKASCIIYLCLANSWIAMGQQLVVEGHIFDARDNSPMPFTNVRLRAQRVGTSTDEYGYFKLNSYLPVDTLEVTFIGYEPQRRIIIQGMSEPFEIYLQSTTHTLQEIRITGEKSKVVTSFEDMTVSKHNIDKATVMRLPSIAGEPDFLKTLLLLPGATKGIEGTSDIFVRGGDADQNLVLFNGAPVYNTGHLFGFLSIFNPFVVSDVSMYTGGFPAEYGGRLSSIIDTKSKSPLYDQFQMEGSIGTISSNLALEIPISKEKVGLMVGGRRTYADQVIKLFGESLPYYFYDFNAQLDFRASEDLQFSYHFYKGEDVLDFQRETDANSQAGSSFDIENTLHTLSIDQRLSNVIQAQTQIYYAHFYYDIFSFYQDNRLKVNSTINDVGLRQIFDYKPSLTHNFRTGLDIVRHRVDPNLINTEGELAELIPSSEGEPRDVLEGALFSSWKYLNDPITTELGLRLSTAILENKTYVNLEPRANLRWQLNDHMVMKGSYSRMYQYIHRVSSSSFALPTDIWYPVTSDIKPQFSDQVSVGFQYLFPKKDLLASVDVYHKQMQNLIEFKEGTNLAFNNEIEDALLQGDGDSYGLELLVKKESGKLNGWLAYTLSWSNRQFDALNNGNPFRARYDRRHNISLVTNYQIHPRLTIAAVWEFLSGARFTPITGYYAVPNAGLTGVDLIPIYPERNSVGLNDSHRLDLSVTWHGKERPGKKWKGEWQLSVYNVYNRATPIAIDLIYDDVNNRYYYEQPGLFGTLPAISYRFTFK